MESIYDELRRIARDVMRRERSNHTLQPTEVVHEAWRRAARAGITMTLDSKAAIASMFRNVLIDHARRRSADKRGKNRIATAADVDSLTEPDRAVSFDALLSLSEALNQLAERAPRQARVVELKFLGGMTTNEVAEAVGTSTRTVENEWRFARAWLHGKLADNAQLDTP